METIKNLNLTIISDIKDPVFNDNNTRLCEVPLKLYENLALLHPDLVDNKRRLILVLGSQVIPSGKGQFCIKRDPRNDIHYLVYVQEIPESIRKAVALNRVLLAQGKDPLELLIELSIKLRDLDNSYLEAEQSVKNNKLRKKQARQDKEEVSNELRCLVKYLSL